MTAAEGDTGSVDTSRGCGRDVKAALVGTLIARSTFSRYVRDLQALNHEAEALGALPHASVDLAHGHLDGRAGRELRAAVSISELRRIGAFFTGDRLGDALIAHEGELASFTSILDPACGCGDLLLAVARRLPIERTVSATLRAWGRVLHGIDREPEFVEVARHRLALLAAVRGARPVRGARLDLASLLPGVVVGNGREPVAIGKADLLLLNPPYGQIVTEPKPAWASGKVTEAALWIDDALRYASPGTRLLAILPDVLRSGSRYSRWRNSLWTRARVLHVASVGQFDALTDVDVFMLHAERHDAADSAMSWQPAKGKGAVLKPARGEQFLDDHRQTPTLQDTCRISVGTVVDGRDAHRGQWVPYVTTGELPQGGLFTPTRKRRFGKRLFAPPFLVVRRTSRPTDDGPRLRPVVILGTDPVAVENHLLVIEPLSERTVQRCVHLADELMGQDVTDWLNARIRLRHMTVTAMRELPRPVDASLET
jgi:hypothetical protein